MSARTTDERQEREKRGARTRSEMKWKLEAEAKKKRTKKKEKTNKRQEASARLKMQDRGQASGEWAFKWRHFKAAVQDENSTRIDGRRRRLSRQVEQIGPATRARAHRSSRAPIWIELLVVALVLVAATPRARGQQADEAGE